MRGFRGRASNSANIRQLSVARPTFRSTKADTAHGKPLSHVQTSTPALAVASFCGCNRMHVRCHLMRLLGDFVSCPGLLRSHANISIFTFLMRSSSFFGMLALCGKRAFSPRSHNALALLPSNERSACKSQGPGSKFI